MKTTRTILIVVNDLTGEVRSAIVGEQTAPDAHTKALKLAVSLWPELNYWYRAVVHFQGSRLAIVQCTKKNT